MNYEGYTDVGQREINEDDFAIAENQGRYFFAVADGLGGHGKGEVASSLAIKTAVQYFYEHPEENLNQVMARCFEVAQEAVMKQIAESGKKSELKTTMVILFIEKEKAILGHIGDSRAYHIRKRKIHFVTLDHSVPQMLVLTKEIKRNEIRFHPDRNRLLKVIGMEWNAPKYEISPLIQVKSGDSFLLCCDGVWELFDELDLIDIVAAQPSAEKCIMRIKEACKNHSKDYKDNNTAVVVKVE